MSLKLIVFLIVVAAQLNSWIKKSFRREAGSQPPHNANETNAGISPCCMLLVNLA
jgi:hypothetical protein